MKDFVLAYAQNYSTYADVITGFSVSQIVILLFLLLQHDRVRQSYHNRWLVLITVVAIVAFAGLYMFGVWHSHGEELRLLKEIKGIDKILEQTISRTRWNQCLVIGVFHFLGIASVSWHYWSSARQAVHLQRLLNGTNR